MARLSVRREPERHQRNIPSRKPAKHGLVMVKVAAMRTPRADNHASFLDGALYRLLITRSVWFVTVKHPQYLARISGAVRKEVDDLHSVVSLAFCKRHAAANGWVVFGAISRRRVKHDEDARQRFTEAVPSTVNRITHPSPMLPACQRPPFTPETVTVSTIWRNIGSVQDVWISHYPVPTRKAHRRLRMWPQSGQLSLVSPARTGAGHQVGVADAP
jgi:hypothetical protein